MTPFIETLKSLYQANRLSEAKVDSLVTEGKITQQELEYVKG